MTWQKQQQVANVWSTFRLNYVKLKGSHCEQHTHTLLLCTLRYVFIQRFSSVSMSSLRMLILLVVILLSLK